MIPSAFQVGGLAIRLYGLFVALAVFLLWRISKARAPAYKISKEVFDDLLLLITPAAIIGARIYHVLHNLDYYRANPDQIIALWLGGLAIYGALIGGGIALFLYCLLKKISLLAILDLASPQLLLVQGIGRLGNFFNLEAYGPPTDLPWKIYIPPERRVEVFADFSYFHPTFFYEMAHDLIFASFLFYLASRKRVPQGTLFAFYLIFFGLGRLWTEFFRVDTWQIGSLKIAQVLAVLTILLGLFLLRGIKGSFFFGKFGKLC